MPQVSFGLLGPFDVQVEGEQVVVAGAAERALLTLLLLSPGRSVPATSLIDRLWADSVLPVDPVNALQLRVSKLRRALATAGLEIVQRDGVGYRVDVDPESIDAEAFVRRIRAVRADAAAGQRPTAQHLARYDAALALWRGDALADFASESWAVAESVRLEELRTAARVERAQAALALGRHAEVVTDLEPAVRADPTQEAMAGLLMVALYQGGRQAGALDVFTRTRTLLDEELGLEPSASLRSLHERVLRQDESLGGPTDLAVPTPAAPTPAAADATNLPAVLPPLVGRADQLAAVGALVGEARLVTLVGPGGAGKTTLGLHVAVALRDTFPDGVVVVRLAPVREPGQVATAVAFALGVPQDGSAADLDVQERLVDYLSGKSMLLLLDNCEHLIDAAATLVDELLAHCPGVAVIATSREALAVPGEVQTLVGPLASPPESATPEEVPDFPAAELLLARVRATRPGREWDSHDLAAVGRICRALDGLPLALELAAARTASLSLPEIAERLDQRFAVLTTGMRTAEDRQRTLRATVDWSYDLLDELEKRVFVRLGVFHGGWTLTAAEAVMTDADTDTAQVLHAVGRLVEQSLVVADPGPVTRYQMLETLREYAADRLTSSGQADELSRRHARYYAALADEAGLAMRGHGQRDALRALRSEHANLRAALQLLSGPTGDLDEALRMAGRLGLFWHQGRHLEGRQLLRRLLARDDGSAAARAFALQAASLVERPRACLVHPHPRCAAAALESMEVFRQVGDESAAALSQTLLAVEGVNGLDPDAARLLDEAETRFRVDDDAWGLAVIGFVRMETALKTGDESGALALGRTAAAAFRGLDDLWGLSAVLYHLGWGLRQFGRYAEAARTLEEAIDVAALAGVDNTVQWALADLGVTQLHLGQPSAAEDAFRRAEIASVQVGDRAGRALATYGRGLLALERDDWTVAQAHFAAAVDGFAALGTPVMEGQAAIGLGRAHEGLGEPRAADDQYRRALDIAATAGEPALVAAAHEGLARLAAADGDAAGARDLLAVATEARTAGHRPATPLDQRDLDRLDRLLTGS